MYNKSVAIIGTTIEKITKYDQFQEDKIRMELYRLILSLYDEGYRTYICHLHTYIGLLAADTIVMLREANKCSDTILNIIILDTYKTSSIDKFYCSLYHDLLKQADCKDMFSKEDSLKKVFSNNFIICLYEDSSVEFEYIYSSGVKFINILRIL